MCVKQVPDTATQVKIAAGGKAIETGGITWIVSPYDEFAVEEALRIKEKRGQGEVIAMSLGPDRVKEALRSALAMGCDRAIHVNDPALAAADTLTTARVLAAVVKQEAPGLVLDMVNGWDSFFRLPRDERLRRLGNPVDRARLDRSRGFRCGNLAGLHGAGEAGRRGVGAVSG